MNSVITRAFDSALCNEPGYLEDFPLLCNNLTEFTRAGFCFECPICDCSYLYETQDMHKYE